MGRNGSFHIAIDDVTCVQCAGCVSICPTEALHMQGLTLECHDPTCIGCDLCVRFCPVVALSLHALSAPPVRAEA
ncbi:MAG: 4Fe-4S binding protein [Candidatus Latescibacterota bacterium]|nr:MAG: 4Fe-4S binding protein [Candidatus Latescibacterota bacterium]